MCSIKLLHVIFRWVVPSCVAFLGQKRKWLKHTTRALCACHRIMEWFVQKGAKKTASTIEASAVTSERVCLRWRMIASGPWMKTRSRIWLNNELVSNFVHKSLTLFNGVGFYYTVHAYGVIPILEHTKEKKEKQQNQNQQNKTPSRNENQRCFQKYADEASTKLCFLWLHIWMTDDYVTNFLRGTFSSLSFTLKGDT